MKDIKCILKITHPYFNPAVVTSTVPSPSLFFSLSPFSYVSTSGGWPLSGYPLHSVSLTSQFENIESHNRQEPYCFLFAMGYQRATGSI